MKSELIQPAQIETFVYPKNWRDRVTFSSDECEFSPSGWAKIEGKFYPLGYKIVTTALRSLGLRKNPSIMTFPVGEWVKLSDEEVIPGICDEGGIWMARCKGDISTYKNYMLEKHQTVTRAFLAAMYRPVFANDGRTKSQGVMLLQEIL